MSDKLYKFKFQKIVRDKIKDKLKAKNINVISKVLDSSEYQKAIKSKLLEEVNELILANNIEEIIEELADVYEVLEAIIHEYQINWTAIEEKRAAKTLDNGGFLKKDYIDYVEVSQDNPAVEYYRAKNYEEIID